ncbi:OprO/OprP family phosphate-selective porin [Alteromonas sp. ALT199]|uniref:porin n=1 Tax=unclassified Alteromonas TaxID=2614992 RepID=UPI001BEBB262|nr:porin [Alteromonas sp. ALT199]MBT3135276.1 OprO/OprP family phosphate-selective porin [Alteromonas sp. ALT199]
MLYQYRFSLCLISSAFFALLFSSAALASKVDAKQESYETLPAYNGDGLVFHSDNNGFSLRARGRVQFRYANPGIGQPTELADFNHNAGNQFGINRARVKLDGHIAMQWINYAVEYDAVDQRTLSATLAFEKYDALRFKFGQWKVEYSRERSVSSGGQQMMDRSIINRIFTLDRQMGASIYGYIDNGGAANFNYWAGVFNGSGRGDYSNHDGEAMYSGRLQWNFLGKEVGFKNSDIARSSTPKAAIAIAGARFKSQFTRFSSSGAGNLTHFDEGETEGQYDIRQFLIDGAYFYQGFNAQAEYHEKEIVDAANDNIKTTLRGYYVQAGYFLNESLSWWPKPLEVAVRYATYSPNTSEKDEDFYEKSLAFNWFFNGHGNKLTAQVSRISLDQFDTEVGDSTIYSLQWDISF